MALLIYDVTSGTDAKNYYAACVSPGSQSDRQGYYSEGQEAPGVYGGKLGEHLTLSGKAVDKASFELLCDNRHPTEDRPLTPRTNDFRRVCKDFTFSGPKSFSIIEAFASPEERKRLRAAFDEAIAETVACDIEPDMQCRQRAKGADYDIRTGNVLTAGFDHSTARPKDAGTLPDPHWHKHLLFWNATLRPDGRVQAGQFGNIVRDKGYYEAAFYSRLAGRLEELGYVIDRRGGKEWEIAGVPQSAIDKFSKRTAQIDAEAERLGITDAKTKAGLGAKIRGKKQKELTLPELRKAWAGQLTASERDALAAVYRKEVAAGPEVTAANAVAYAVQHCFERESVVSERELKRVALLYGLGSVSLGQVSAELPRQGVIVGDKDGRRMATTMEVHRQERFITGFAANGRGSVEPVGVASGLERGILDDDQWNAVTGLLGSYDRVQLVDSAAGVGKSTMLQVYDKGMKVAGKHVTYLATTTPAVGVLREDGFGAETVAKFLLSETMQAAAKGGAVVVDEASMLGLRDAYRLFNLARDNNLTLVFLGDSRQHSCPAAGAFMRLLREYGGIQPYRIATIKRQKNEKHKLAVGLMFEGRTMEGFDVLDKKLGWVKEIQDDGQRYGAIAAEYVQTLKDGEKWNELLLISPTHAEGQLAVEAVRHRLRQEGMIGKKDYEFTRWVSSDLTEAERGDLRCYPGKVDMIQFHQNAKGHRIGTRLAVGEETLASLPLGQAAKFQAYRRDTVQFAVNDIIRFTANGMTLDGHQIRNGSAYKIAGFTARGIRLDNGWLVAKEFGHWKLGIETSFGSQSRTVSHAIVAAASSSFAAATMEAAYVSASRSRHRVSYYTDDKQGLRDAIKRSSLKLTAFDVVKPPPAQAAKPRRTWRQRLAHWQRLALLGRTRAAEAGRQARQPQPERLRPHGYGR